MKKFHVAETEASLNELLKTDNGGRTALRWPKSEGRDEVVKYLVSKMDAEAKQLALRNKSNQGYTEFHYAALHGHKM